VVLRAKRRKEEEGKEGKTTKRKRRGGEEEEEDEKEEKEALKRRMRGVQGSSATSTTSSKTLLSFLFAVILITALLFVVHLSSLRQTSDQANDALLSQMHHSHSEDQQCHRTLNLLGVNQEVLMNLLQEYPNSLDLLDRLLLSDTLIQNAFEPVWCVTDLLKTLEKHREEYDPTLFDLLKMNVMSMTVYNQKMHIYKPILKEEGFYLRNASEVRRRLDKYQKPFCDPDGGGNNKIENNNEQHLRVGICTMQHSNGPHIQEFVAHYLLMGASKVYIYDNADPETFEDKYFRRVIAPFVEAGVVEVVDWFFTEGDLFRAKEAFDHCFQVGFDNTPHSIFLIL